MAILNKKKSNKRGFTLLAVMVAVFILVIGFISILGLMAASIKYGSQEEQRLVALGLAQEGIELVRNVRDTNYNEGSSYNDSINTSGQRKVDHVAVPTDLQAFASEYDMYVLNGFYEHRRTPPDPAAVLTIFEREISIDNTPDALGRKVVCEVRWEAGSQTKSIELVHYLYDWY